MYITFLILVNASLVGMWKMLPREVGSVIAFQNSDCCIYKTQKCTLKECIFRINFFKCYKRLGVHMKHLIAQMDILWPVFRNISLKLSYKMELLDERSINM
jgi:hypothetical protein